MSKSNGMLKSDIIAEIKTIISKLINNEQGLRLQYINDKYDNIVASQKSIYTQLDENSLWMSLYSDINWLAHFRFLKTKEVDRYIPKWLARVFNWSEEFSEAFWACGRDPIAHTGNRNQGYSQNIREKKYYIQLSLDKPDDWNTTNGYYALSPMKKDIGDSPLPAQQIVFFYESIAKLTLELVKDIEADISNLDYTKIISLASVCESFYFINDDGSLFRTKDLLRVYKYAE